MDNSEHQARACRVFQFLLIGLIGLSGGYTLDCNVSTKTGEDVVLKVAASISIVVGWLFATVGVIGILTHPVDTKK